MLAEYIQSLKGLNKLTQQEESLLWHKFKIEGQIEARQELIEHYQLLVFKEALKYQLQETLILDLIQEGVVGLMEAAERYNHTSGVAFSLYALHRVRGRMIDFLRIAQKELLFDQQDEQIQNSLFNKMVPDVAFECADRRELNKAIEQAFERLPKREKDVIQNVYYQEKSALETANIMDVSATYVYQLEKKGIRRLRGILSKLMHERKWLENK